MIDDTHIARLLEDGQLPAQTTERDLDELWSRTPDGLVLISLCAAVDPKGTTAFLVPYVAELLPLVLEDHELFVAAIAGARAWANGVGSAATCCELHEAAAGAAEALGYAHDASDNAAIRNDPQPFIQYNAAYAIAYSAALARSAIGDVIEAARIVIGGSAAAHAYAIPDADDPTR